MERNNYKCNKCNTEFHALPYQTKCTNPICGSTDTEPIATNVFSTLLVFSKKNWRLTLPIIGIIILFLLFRGCDGCNNKTGGGDTPWKGEIIIDGQRQGTNYIEFTIVKKIKKGENEYVKDKNQPTVDEYKRLVKIYVTGKNKQVAFEKNRIYLCQEDANKEISLTFQFTNDNVDQKEIPRPVELMLNGLEVSPKAICGLPDLFSEDITITPIGKCEVEVKLAKSFPGKTVMISFNGRGGKYSSKTIYDVSGLQDKFYDVWVYLVGQNIDSTILSPIPSYQNTALVSSKGCINPEDLVKVRNTYQKEFFALLSKYLNNSDPNNLTFGDATKNYFYDKFQGKGNVILVDGKNYRDWPELENFINDFNLSLTKKGNLKLNKVEVSKDCSSVTISISSN